MKRALVIASAVLAALVLAATGAYVLWQFHSTAGLIVGVSLVLLAVATALPIPLHGGAVSLKDNAVVIMPVVLDAVRGGDRHTDPPAPPA